MTRPNIEPNGVYVPEGQSQRLDLSQVPLSQLIGLAEAARARGGVEAAIDLYEAWLAFRAEADMAHVAYFNLGVAYNEAGRAMAAIRAFRECARLAPDFPQARLNLGRALENAGRPLEAYNQWRVGLDALGAVTGERVAQKTLLLTQCARLFEQHLDDAEAERMLEQAIELDSHHIEAIRQSVGVRTRLCRWPALVPSPRVTMREKLATLWPLTVATLSDDPLFQLARGYAHAREEYARPTAQALREVREARATARREGRRLRIGYVSSDLREHAVGHAMTQVFEEHDKSRFEIFAYYCGIDRDDRVRRRIVAAAEHWVDINGMSDEEASLRVAGDGVDILVDLNGYTKFARTRMFSLRPAPVIVNWFGFPATMGTPYHNYIVADAGIIPEGDEIYFSEEVLRLPCYQPNDRLRQVAEVTPSRRDFGLPDDAFVYCSFNGAQKLTRRMFETWLDILAQTPGSVLWLLKTGGDVDARLTAYAGERGVTAERLVFADKLPNPEHLARYPLADLFLDSFPYGAHTTASDALWMGVPVLTRQGRTFAARVCSSLLRAAGVPELIAHDEAEYRAKAIVLHHNRHLIREFKQRLAAAREASALFDIDRLVRSLEGLYVEMAAREAAGETPRPDMTNLDVYHDVALDMDVDAVNAMSREAYLAAYMSGLSERDAFAPLTPDNRLWRRAASEARRAAAE